MSLLDPFEKEPEVSLTDALNAEQLQAVTTTNGNTLVLAGAGSGKTKVLTTRIAWLLDQELATEDSILAVTFTNKAAKEMKGRITKLIGRKPRNLWVGTFHGLCLQMLKEFPDAAGVPSNFHVIDTDDQKSICKRLMKEMNVDTYKPADVADYINKIKEGTFSLGEVTILDEIFQKYTAICEREGALDFADLMHKVNIALSANAGGIRQHYNARFSHFLVDEFQDTNKEQYKWLRLLKAPTSEIFVVGDDDQSIYSFRGASPENMQDFIKGVKQENIIRLEQNYRSTSNILNAANSVIDNNSGRIGKTLRTDTGDGTKVKISEFVNGYDEADFIAKRTKDMIAGGVEPKDIAVLYRSNHQSGSIERSLLRSGVPYMIHGGTRFFERQEIKDAVGYLRLALNQYDDSAFYRIVNFPTRGLGGKTLKNLELGVTASEYEVSMMEIARQSQLNVPKLVPFIEIIDALDEQMNIRTLSDSILYMYEKTGLLKHYSIDDDDKARVNHLQELISLAKMYEINEARPEANTKERLMEFLATFTLEDTKEQDAGYGKSAITLMTIHAAKGLEFNEVFITGAEEGVLPHKNSLEDASAIEEERRLMYVAITRAKKNLNVTLAQERRVFGEDVFSDPSRFIAELPGQAIEHNVFEATKPYSKGVFKSTPKNKSGSKDNRELGPDSVSKSPSEMLEDDAVSKSPFSPNSKPSPKLRF